MNNRAIINTDRLKKILKYVSTLNNANQITMMFKFSFQGLRLCNWYRLQLKDIIDGNNEIVEMIHLQGDKNKGGKKVIYYLNDELRKDLKEYIKGWDLNNKERYLFVSYKTGRPYQKNSLTNLFHKIYNDMGIENCSTHCGRRNFITNLLVNGVDITTVKELVGHSFIQTTALYYNTNESMLKNVVNKNKI